MKCKTPIYLVLLFLMLSLNTASYGGFFIKPKTETSVASTINSEAPVVAHKKTFSERRIPQLLSFNNNDGRHKHNGPGHKSGTMGILALIFGVVGVTTFFLAIAALVLGIIGLNKKKYKNTGMALAGLILGGLTVLAYIALVVIFAGLILI